MVRSQAATTRTDLNDANARAERYAAAMLEIVRHLEAGEAQEALEAARTALTGVPYRGLDSTALAKDWPIRSELLHHPTPFIGYQRLAYLRAAAAALVKVPYPMSMPLPFIEALQWVRLGVCTCPWPEDAENTRHLMGCPNPEIPRRRQ